MTDLQKEIYNESISIGDELCSKAILKDGFHYWDTLQSDLEQNTYWGFTESLYSGSSGIALFLLELHLITEEKKYLDTALSHAGYLEKHCKENDTHSWAFLTGRTGVSYFFLRLFEVTNSQHYLSVAESLIENCLDMAKGDYLVDDYINGASGTLTYLLKLYHYSQTNSLENKISKLAEHLVHQAQLGPKGLYWDRSEKQKYGLCGFSHGVSGVAFSFFELGKITGNDAFTWLAEFSLTYEDHHYNAERKNWPDFRHGIYKEEDYQEQKEKFLENDLAYFQTGGDMNAWCHGAMGIGLTRKRAYELTGNNKYLNELSICNEKTKQTTNVELGEYKRSYTLCHGGGGNADVYIQSYLLTKEKKYLDLAEEVAKHALNARKKDGMYYSGLSYAKEEDTSLFMGTAGVGYFFLRTLFPEKVHSILSLEYNHETTVKNDSFLNSSAKDLLSRLTSKDFSESSKEIDVTNLLNSKKYPTRDEIYFYVKEQTKSNQFKKEETKYFLENNAISASYINISELVNQEFGKNYLENNTVENTTLKLSERVLLQSQDEDEHLMLTLSPLGVREHTLSPFSYVVLASFEEEQNVDSVLPSIYEMFESTEKDEQEKIKSAVFDQIESALRGGILELEK